MDPFVKRVFMLTVILCDNNIQTNEKSRFNILISTCGVGSEILGA